jgi:hypothetical protein
VARSRRAGRPRSIIPAVPLLRTIVDRGRKWATADWISLAGVLVAIVAATLAYQQVKQGSGSLDEAKRANDIAASAEAKHPNLQIAAEVSASNVGNLDATVSSPDGSEPAKVSGTLLDITLRNRAPGASLITKAEVTFEVAQRLKQCTLDGGPITVSANYDIAVPDEVPLVPFTLTKDIRYEVPSDAHERFTLSIGPKTVLDGHYPFVSAVRVVLLHDDGRRLALGRFALIDIGGSPSFYPESAVDPAEDGWVLPPLDAEVEGCMRENARTLDRIMGIDKTVPSKEFAALVERLDEEGL